VTSPARFPLNAGPDQVSLRCRDGMFSQLPFEGLKPTNAN